jgi:hypothetical protein
MEMSGEDMPEQMRFERNRATIGSLEDHAVQEEAHAGGDRLSEQMPVMELKEIGARRVALLAINRIMLGRIGNLRQHIAGL